MSYSFLIGSSKKTKPEEPYGGPLPSKKKEIKNIPESVSNPVLEKTDDVSVLLERTKLDMMENQVEYIAHFTTTKSTKLSSFNKKKMLFVFFAILILVVHGFVGFFKLCKKEEETLDLDNFIFYLQEHEEGRLGKDKLIQKCSILAKMMSFQDAVKYDSYEYTIAHILLSEPIKRDDLFKQSINYILSFEAFVDCGYNVDESFINLIDSQDRPPGLFALAYNSFSKQAKQKKFTKQLVQGPPQSDEDCMLLPLIIQNNGAYPYKDQILKVLKFDISLLCQSEFIRKIFSENSFYKTTAILAILEKNKLYFKNIINYNIINGLDKSFLALQRHEVACGGVFNKSETSFLNDTDLFSLAEIHSTESNGNIRIFEAFKNAQYQRHEKLRRQQQLDQEHEQDH